ncbi:uncharacterized protein [Salminus brasiliensis]|uniref:uncharacterized protein n=1 Tax=Salminus brasiliensis TaxID=930266 RepID=UPI003B834593
MNLLAAMLVPILALMFQASGQSNNLHSSCCITYDQEHEIHSCNITRPYEEFCSSGCCKYPVLPAFLDHLKKKHCEATWYTPDNKTLADPFYPKNLSDPALNVTLESLTTKQHVEGLRLNIHCDDTNKRYQAIYRVVNNTSAAPMPPDQPEKQTMYLSVGAAVVSLAVVLVAVAALIYYCRQTGGGEGQGGDGEELENLGGAEAPVKDENQALNLNME